jgi:tetratricopeptide (TPR) repeat protein
MSRFISKYTFLILVMISILLGCKSDYEKYRELIEQSRIHLKSSNYEKARSALNQCLELTLGSYDKSKVYFNIAFLEQHLGNYSNATQRYSDGIASCNEAENYSRCFPCNIYLSRARCYDKLDSTSLAVKDTVSYFECFGSEIFTFLHWRRRRSAGLSETELKRAKQANINYSFALRIIEKDTSYKVFDWVDIFFLLRYRAETYAALSLHNEAINDYSRAIKLDADCTHLIRYTDLHIDRAYSAIRVKDTIQACQDWTLVNQIMGGSQYRDSIVKYCRYN